MENGKGRPAEADYDYDYENDDENEDEEDKSSQIVMKLRDSTAEAPRGALPIGWLKSLARVTAVTRFVDLYRVE